MKQLDERKNKELLKSWKERAGKVKTLEQFQMLFTELTSVKHDYGTIVHAVTAMALAAAELMNASSVGGITGFQASCVMWQFIQDYMQEKGPMKLMKYDLMLFPQYEAHFQKLISPDIWAHLQEEAAKSLKEKDKFAHPDVTKHWQSIVDGVVPFGYTVEEE